MNFNSTILIIPGLGNSGPQHWQTIWERRFNFKRVEQNDWETPVCSDWINNINKEAAKYNSGEIVLVGHSLACTTIAYWAQAFNVSIKGALLVAPSDTEADSYPSGTSGFEPVPLIKLPFPTTVVASNNDFYVTTERAKLFADSWGSDFIDIGNAGHINVASGFGEWNTGLEILRKIDH